MASVCPITSLEQFNSSLRSLNRVLAQYKQLLRQVGSVTDCAKVREQLQSLSVRLLASFAVSKDVILPAMQSHQATAGAAEAIECDEESEATATRKQWEARYTTFVQIVESTLDNLVRTAALVRRFPLRPDSLNGHVATGIAEFFNVERRSILSLSSSLRSSRRSSMSSGSRISVLGAASVGSGTPEGENSPGSEFDSQHLTSLAAEIRATRELIDQLQSAVLIAHWTVQHKFDFEFSTSSGGGASSGGSSGGTNVAATVIAAAAAAASAGTSAARHGDNAARRNSVMVAEAWADPDGADDGDGQSSPAEESDEGPPGGFASFCLICK